MFILYYLICHPTKRTTQLTYERERERAVLTTPCEVFEFNQRRKRLALSNRSIPSTCIYRTTHEEKSTNQPRVFIEQRTNRNQTINHVYLYNNAHTEIKQSTTCIYITTHTQKSTNQPRAWASDIPIHMFRKQRVHSIILYIAFIFSRSRYVL